MPQGSNGLVETEPSPLAKATSVTIESCMVAAANMVEVAALVGDTARATMLSALMGGQALTASELATRARITKSTASGHLTKLVRARLLTVTQKRRNRYFRIASPLVAKMLESIKAVAAIEAPARHQPRSTHDDRLRLARTCYDHLAGRLGVAISDALVSKGFVVLTDDGGEVTAAGAHFLADFGMELTPKSKGKRIFCRPCLDWSERRYHIAGHVGAELLRRFAELGWFERDGDSRAVWVTAAGKVGLRDVFGITAKFDSQLLRRP
jgi:DNA-binding transcriptional ArsR family regulator